MCRVVRLGVRNCRLLVNWVLSVWCWRGIGGSVAFGKWQTGVGGSDPLEPSFQDFSMQFKDMSMLRPTSREKPRESRDHGIVMARKKVSQVYGPSINCYFNEFLTVGLVTARKKVSQGRRPKTVLISRSMGTNPQVLV